MKYHKLLFLLICVQLQTASSAQDQSFDYTKFTRKEIALTRNDAALTLPFHHVKVIDKRNDTIPLLIELSADSRYKSYTYFTFKDGTSAQIESFLRHSFSWDTSSHFDLLMVIRKMWASSIISNPTANGQDWSYGKKLKPGIQLQVEFYLQQGYNYVPLKRFDTMIQGSYNVVREYPALVSDVLKFSLESISRVNAESTYTLGKKLSIGDVQQFSDSHLNYPILQTRYFKKGVYTSYEEFKNNAPSIQDYRIQTTTEAHTLYVKDPKGEEYSLRTAWGFCDGENIYVRSAGLYFRLYYYKNNFYTNAIVRFSRKKRNNWPDLLPPPSQDFLGNAMIRTYESIPPKLMMEAKIVQLDLSTGTLY